MGIDLACADLDSVSLDLFGLRGFGQSLIFD